MQDQTNDILPKGKTRKEPVNNTAKLDPVNPIPIDYGSNIFTVISGQRYLPFLGREDNLPNVFWESRLISATHDSCIKSIAQTCVGGGIQVLDMEPEQVDKEFLAFIERVNKAESLNDLIRLGMEAEMTDGNAWIEISKGELAAKKYLKAYLYTSLVCRLGEPEENEDPTTVIRSTRFAEKRNRVVSSRSLKAASIPLYSSNTLDKNASWKADDSKDLHTVIHVKNTYSGVLHYGLPRSVSGLRFQILEGKAAQYNIDNFENNMVMSALIVFKNSMTPKEANTNAKEILKAHTGAGKNGRVGVISSENGIEDFEFRPLETQKEGSYIDLDKRIEQKIITTHNWDAVFFGMGSESALGKGSQYIRAVYDIKKATVIDPICNHWMEAFIKPFIAIAADHFGKKEWLKYKLGFKSAMPFSYSSDIDVNKVITRNEGREMIGKPARKGEEWEQPIDSGKAPQPKQKQKEEVDSDV